MIVYRLSRVTVAVHEVEIQRAIKTQDAPTHIRIDWFGSISKQRPPEQDRSVRVAGLVKDVPWTEFTHPVLRVERPSRSGITHRVDRETLVVLFVPHDCLHDWRGFVGRILVPFDTLRGTGTDERSNLGERAVGEGELARIRVNLVDEPAVVPTTNRHTWNQGSQRIVLRAHVSEPIVLTNIGVVLQDALEHICSGDNREHGFVRGFVQTRHEIATFTVEVHVNVVQKPLGKNSVRVHCRIPCSTTVYTVVVENDLMARKPNVLRSVSGGPDPL